jgi:hypothetical protein
MAILFPIGALAVTVLEIDAKIFHRLARKLVEHPLIYRHGQRLANAHRGCKLGRGSAEFLQRTAGQLPQLGSGVGPEQMASAIHGVHRLPGGSLPGVSPRKLAIGVAE